MAVVTILGAGVMGAAMCLPLVDRGHDVRLVGTHLDYAIIDSLKATGKHPRLNVTLPSAVKVLHHSEFKRALGSDTDIILLGVSSAGIEWAIQKLCDALQGPANILMITKGMQPEAATLTALPDHVQSEIKKRNGLELSIAAIGGPCIAGELAVRRHTGTVITSRDKAFGECRLCVRVERGNRRVDDRQADRGVGARCRIDG